MAWASASRTFTSSNGALRVVDGQDRLALGRADEHLKARVGLELRQVLGRGKAREGVDVACHHRREGCRRIGDELEGGAFERGRLAPVIGVALELDAVALHPVGKAEGAGADRVGLDVVDAFGGHDGGVAPGHVEREVAVGLAEADLDRLRIDDCDLLDAGEELFLGVGGVLGAGAVERELHVLGIHGGAVVEGHPVAQVEGVGRAVVGNVPAFGEARDDRTVAREPGQALEDVGIGHVVDRAGRRAGRIEMGRFKLDSDRQAVLGERARGGQGQRARQKDARHQSQSSLCGPSSASRLSAMTFALSTMSFTPIHSSGLWASSSKPGP